MSSTIFKNIYSKEPHYVSPDILLGRIKSGSSKEANEEIRAARDKEKRQALKAAKLPAVCWSGKFGPERTDANLIEHSALIVLDFDDLPDLREKQQELINNPYVYACWVSPSGNGLKVLIKIADGKKHREHFAALQEEFPGIDPSGANPSRVCYESWDPGMYVNKDAKMFHRVKTTEVVAEVTRTSDHAKIFANLLTWLANKNEAFVTGNRNNFIFLLAGACCRYGLPDDVALSHISLEFLANSGFPLREAQAAVRSAYKANRGQYGACSFENERLIDRVSRKEIKVAEIAGDQEGKLRDVVYGVEVKEKALAIYENGYEAVQGIGVSEIDERWKPKRGEISLLSGYGNHGKSAWLKWYLIVRILLYKEKFAVFGPEDNPAEEYYHDIVEILLGGDCTPANANRPAADVYERAYDLISNHLFYVYPRDLTPSPEYIKERFLELIVKEKVDGLIIDPFNQLMNDYGKSGRTDKYLETLLGDFSRYAQANSVYFLIIAHPIKAAKMPTGNYPCPDVFDIADGAMWNNKMDNILIYHRPFHSTEPDNPICELHSKKIRRQKTVGKRGFLLFEMHFARRRFFVGGKDVLQKIIDQKGPEWLKRSEEAGRARQIWMPYADKNENPF